MKYCKDCDWCYKSNEVLFCSIANKPCKVERRYRRFLSWLFITCGKQGRNFEKDFLEPSNDKSKITFEAIEKTAMSFSKHGVEVGRLTADGDFYFGNIAELKKKAYLVGKYDV